MAFSIGERIWPQVDIETDAACEPLLTDCPDNLGLVVMELVRHCTQKPEGNMQNRTDRVNVRAFQELLIQVPDDARMQMAVYV